MTINNFNKTKETWFTQLTDKPTNDLFLKSIYEKQQLFTHEKLKYGKDLINFFPSRIKTEQGLFKGSTTDIAGCNKTCLCCCFHLPQQREH